MTPPADGLPGGDKVSEFRRAMKVEPLQFHCGDDARAHMHAGDYGTLRNAVRPILDALAAARGGAPEGGGE
jgi:hypothetical protein